MGLPLDWRFPVLTLWLVLAVNSSSPAENNRDREGVDRAEVTRLEVSKAARELTIFYRDTAVETVRIGLGFSPLGHKEREGDGATPEGDYSVCIKNPQSRYYLSLGINYPNAEDAEEALADGRLSEDQARAIQRADRTGQCPPWNTPLGGEIFIHGRGSSGDWTLGCIALEDSEMKRLFESVSVGIPVTIRP